MNDLLIALNLQAWKPVLSLWVMPPLPLWGLILLGALWLKRRRVLGWTLVLLGLAGNWAVCTTAVGTALSKRLLQPPPVLTAQQISELKASPHTAILVLGAGNRPQALEYGGPDLKPFTLERMRYGLWLGRQTGLPVGFSGGLGYGALPGVTEAAAAQRVAQRDFGQTLRWLEDRSRDTNENAIHSVALLHQEGVQRIVLVTHGFHQRRALAAFERAIARSGQPMTLLAAPLGINPPPAYTPGDWLPTGEGFQLCRLVFHEWLGRLAGA